MLRGHAVMQSVRSYLANQWDSYLQRWPIDENGLPLPYFDRLHTKYRALEAQVKQQAALHQYLTAHTMSWTTAQQKRVYVLKKSGLSLSLSDRLAVCGYTGCGKTTLASEWADRMSRLFPMASIHILDSKRDDFFDNDPDIFEGQELPPIMQPGERVVWRPHYNDIELYDQWFEQLLRAPKRPMIIWVDELASIGGEKGQVSFPHNYILTLKQGRNLGKHVISLTQEAAYIPRQVFGQTSHLVRMRLIDDFDARKMDRMIHGKADVRQEPAAKFGLWYRRLNVQGGPAKEFHDWRGLLDAA